MIYTKEYWNLEWASVFEHYQQDIRHGHYIHAVLRPDEKKYWSWELVLFVMHRY